MESRSDFILAAINDTQSTIRSIDVKVAALLTGLLIPLSSLGKIWEHLYRIYSVNQSLLSIGLGVLFFVSWLIAVYSLVRTMSAIDNPADHIVNANDFKGTFYGGGLYSFGWPDVVFNRTAIKARKDVVSYSKDYPGSEGEIISELSFEHMKLIYIREIKLYRFKHSMKISTIWLVLGLYIYCYSKFS